MDDLDLTELLLDLTSDLGREVSADLPDDEAARLAHGTALDLWRLVVRLRTGAEPRSVAPAAGDAVWLRLRVALAVLIGAAPDDVQLDTPLGARRPEGSRYAPGSAARLDALMWQVKMLGGEWPEQREQAVESFTLRDLTAWEERVMARVAAAARGSAGGDPAERDRRLERDRVYADYPVICEGYLARAWSARGSDEGREALRRAVFLLWCSGARPAFLTGVAELPDEMFEAVVSALDEQCQRGALDAELRWMLPRYHAAAPEVFGRFHDQRALQEFLAAAPADAWRRESLRPEAFRGRGQMGWYWEGVLRRG